ncbi:MAG TPA: hypothetical protein VLC08_14635 [Chitinolyticbacter sp.]|nr:hypothetical protein [Chitinolyticbacter sp.]
MKPIWTRIISGVLCTLGSLSLISMAVAGWQQGLPVLQWLVIASATYGCFLFSMYVATGRFPRRYRRNAQT